MTIWQADQIFERLYLSDPINFLVHFGITIGVLSLLALVASYLAIHTWLNRPKTKREWLWQGMMAIIAGWLVSLCDVMWGTESVFDCSIRSALTVFMIWSVVAFTLISLLNSVRLFLIWLHSPKTYLLKIVRPAPRSWRVFWIGLGIWSLLIANLTLALWLKAESIYRTNLFDSNQNKILCLERAWGIRTLLAMVCLYALSRMWRNRPKTKRDWFWLLLFAMIFGIIGSLAINQHHSFAGFALNSALLLLVCYAAAFAGFLLLLSFRDFFWWLVSWRILKRFLFGLGIFILTVAFFYAEEDWRGKSAWKQYQAEQIAKGENFDFKDFIPKPVPDEQNFALTPIVATSYEWLLDKNGHEIKPHRTNVVQRLMMQVCHYPSEDTVGHVATTNGNWALGKLTDLKSWQMYYRTPFTNMFWFEDGLGGYWKQATNPDSILTNDFAFPPQPQSPAVDVLYALSKYDSTIEELRAASRLTNSRFPLNYNTRPFQIFGAHFASLKYSSVVLQLRVIAELGANQNQKALEDSRLMLRLLDSVHNEPTEYAQYQRVQMANLLIQPIWEGLVKHQWTDAQLSIIQQELGKLDFVTDYQWSQRCLRNQYLEMIDYMRTDGFKEIINYLKNSKSDSYDPKLLLTETLPLFMPDGWFYRNQLFIAKSHERLSQCLHQSNRALSPKELADVSNQIYSTPTRPWNSIGLRYSSLGTGGRKFAYTQIAIDLARIACALERYELANGNYPDSLAALVPQFIEKIPNDVIGGEPLHYQRTADGKFLLYSVGWNETDDGGTPGTLFDAKKGDWVWKN